jgi:hypothetical protein
MSKSSKAKSQKATADEETCPTCESRVPAGHLIKMAERRTKQRAPTACLGCAECERRPYRIEIDRHAAVVAFSLIVDAHADAKIAKVPNGVMVDVDEVAVLADLITREAKRLRAGGQLPVIKDKPRPGSSTHGLWREPRPRRRKGRK